MTTKSIFKPIEKVAKKRIGEFQLICLNSLSLLLFKLNGEGR
ncbi:hypothetical protein RV02_GL003983 [Enterococcus gilvus]|nr:hypothetical protein RV02_GL003983 [Enterococcus gilvus]